MKLQYRKGIYGCCGFGFYILCALMLIGWFYVNLPAYGLYEVSERDLAYASEVTKILAWLFLVVGFPFGWVSIAVGKKISCTNCRKPVVCYNEKGHVALVFTPLIAIVKGKELCSVCIKK